MSPQARQCALLVCSTRHPFRVMRRSHVMSPKLRSRSRALVTVDLSVPVTFAICCFDGSSLPSFPNMPSIASAIRTVACVNLLACINNPTRAFHTARFSRHNGALAPVPNTLLLRQRRPLCLDSFSVLACASRSQSTMRVFTLSATLVEGRDCCKQSWPARLSQSQSFLWSRCNRKLRS